MPTFSEEEGIWILTDHEEKAKRLPHLDHVLTREEMARGGRNGRVTRDSHPHVFTSEHARMMAQARWRNHNARTQAR